MGYKSDAIREDELVRYPELLTGTDLLLCPDCLCEIVWNSCPECGREVEEY